MYWTGLEGVSIECLLDWVGNMVFDIQIYKKHLRTTGIFIWSYSSCILLTAAASKWGRWQPDLRTARQQAHSTPPRSLFGNEIHPRQFESLRKGNRLLSIELRNTYIHTVHTIVAPFETAYMNFNNSIIQNSLQNFPNIHMMGATYQNSYQRIPFP